MNLATNILTGTNSGLLKTEIMFFIAEAKATGHDLIKLKAEEKQLDTVSKILRSIKKEGTIQLFVFSDSFDDKTTEIEYLQNKYPDIYEIDSDKPFFLIKV